MCSVHEYKCCHVRGVTVSVTEPWGVEANMRQALLLSSVLIGLTVLPLYNSSKTSCDFNWDTIDCYHGDITKYYILFTGYGNISSFDIKSADIADGYGKIRNKIKPFRLYLPSPPKHSMTQGGFHLYFCQNKINF